MIRYLSSDSTSSALRIGFYPPLEGTEFGICGTELGGGGKDAFSVDSAGYGSFSSAKGSVMVDTEEVGRDRGIGDTGQDSLADLVA